MQRCHVALCEVLHMDVVTHTGAIWGCEIMAVYVKMWSQPGRHLRQQRHQVVRCAQRGFPDQTAGMCAHGVEVAQHAYLPAVIGPAQRRQHVFAHQFAVAVGVSVAAWKVFGDGHTRRVTIDCGAARKNQGSAIGRPHGLQ